MKQKLTSKSYSLTTKQAKLLQKMQDAIYEFEQSGGVIVFDDINGRFVFVNSGGMAVSTERREDLWDDKICNMGWDYVIDIANIPKDYEYIDDVPNWHCITGHDVLTLLEPEHI